MGKVEKEARRLYGRWILVLWCVTWLLALGLIWAPFGARWQWAITTILAAGMLLASVGGKETVIAKAVEKVQADGHS